MVREGAEGLGVVGFAVGLFAPPLLAATAVGAALGAGAGGLLHHKVAGKIGEQAGETIPLGGAGLIVAYSQLRGRQGRARRDAGGEEDHRRGRGQPRRGAEGGARRRPEEDGRRGRLRGAAGRGQDSRRPHRA